MRASPGGRLAIGEIHGRDRLIQSIWRTLEGNSVRLEAERRIGKTHILNKMAAEPAEGWEVVALDLERVHSAAEFGERVCEKVHERLTGWKRPARQLQGLLQRFGGVEMGSFRFPDASSRPTGYWKALLTGAVEDLVEQQAEAGKRVVFLFDEMPWMIQAIGDPERDGEATAMEVLDVLRSLRQTSTTGPGFRMVLCGSIGLHHVLGGLRRRGYNNQPVNDMILVEVPPLEPGDAAGLASGLIGGEGLAAEPGAPAMIAERTGGFPYYIHWVVSQLRTMGREARADEIEEVLGWMLTSPYDPCDFRHFKSRISTYYPGQENLVLALLDHAAAAEGSLDQAELIGVGKSAAATTDAQIRDLLRLLAVDHYLTRDNDGRYRFRHVLLRRWWQIEQGLA